MSIQAFYQKSTHQFDVFWVKQEEGFERVHDQKDLQSLQPSYPLGWLLCHSQALLMIS